MNKIRRVISHTLMLALLVMSCVSLFFTNEAKAASSLSISTPSDWSLYSWDDSLKIKWGTVTGASGYYVTILNETTGGYLVQNKYTTSTSFTASSYLPESPARLKIWVGAVTSSSQTGEEAFTSDIVYIYVSHEPGITNGTSSSVTKTSAVLKMSVDYDYGYSITDCGFYIGTSSSISSMEQYSFHDYSTSYGATTKGTKYMTITGLEPGTKYYYRAYAENDVGEEYTSAKNFTTEAGSLADPVITYPVDGNTYSANSSIKLQWKAVSGVDGYRYRIKQLSGAPDRTNENESYINIWKGSVSSSRTYYTLSASNVVGGYWYKFVVESYADGMDSGWSDWCYIYVEKGTLEKPVITYPDADSTIIGYQDIPFVWGEVDYAEEYTYFVKRLSGVPSYVDENESALKTWSATVSSDTTHFTLDESEAIPGYWYKFVVKASAEDMNPSWSEWVYCYLDELKLNDPVLSLPINNSTVSHGESITLKWNAVNNAGGYKYHIKQLSGTPEPENENENSINTWVDTVSAGKTTYTFSGANVVGGYWYKFVIEAYADNADSAWSDGCYVYAESGSLADAVIVYPENTARYTGYQNITLDWNAVSGADGYRYHIKRLSGIPDRMNENEPSLEEWVDSTSASVTSYTFPADEFIPGYWYKFVIESYANGMNTSWSDWVYCYADEVDLEDPVISTPSSWSEVSEGNSILVDWDSVAGAEGYRLYYKQLVSKPDTSNDNELAVNGDKVDCGTTSKYTLSASKVVAGYWYKFVVEAYASGTSSSWSNWVYVYVPENGSLERSVIISPKAAEDYEAGADIMFAWAKVPNATNYTYYVKQLAGEPDYSDNEKATNSWSGTTGPTNRYFTLTGENVQENTWYKFVVKAEADGYDNSWSKYTYIRIPEREDWIHFVLSTAMTQISDEAFEGNALLRTFDASNSRLEIIGSSAFADCTNLQAVYLPMSVFSIADDAFENCPNLTIHCISGSMVEEYAISKGIRVEAHGVAVETDTIQLSRNEWNITGSDRAEAAIRVNSSNTWTASSDSGWLTLSMPAGGDGANVILTASANTTEAARSATVTFSCGQASATIRVTQNASSVKECAMKLHPDYWEPTSNTLTREIVVQHEDGFTVSSNQSWLTYTVSNSTITAKVSADSLSSAKTGILTVTCNDCGATQTVTVTTKGNVVPAPATVKAVSTEPHAVVVKWSAVSGASYTVERSNDGGASWENIGSTDSTSMTDVSDVGAAATYCYRVTAYKIISGSTVYSNSTESNSCTTPAEQKISFLGTIGTIGDNGRAKLDALSSVSWSTISGMTYKLSLKNLSTGSYVNSLNQTDVGAVSSYSLSGLLVEGNQYRVWVGAYNSAGRRVGQTGERVFTVIKPSTEPAPTIVVNSNSPVAVNNSGNSYFGISFTMTNSNTVEFEFDGLQVYEKWDKETQGAKKGARNIWEFDGGDIGAPKNGVPSTTNKGYTYEKTAWTAYFYPIAATPCGMFNVNIKAIGEGGSKTTTITIRITETGIRNAEMFSRMQMQADSWVDYSWTPQYDVPVHHPNYYNADGSKKSGAEEYYYKAETTYYGLPYTLNSSKFRPDTWKDSTKIEYVQVYYRGDNSYKHTPSIGGDCSCLVNDVLWAADQTSISHNGETYLSSTNANKFRQITWDEVMAGDVLNKSKGGAHIIYVYARSGDTLTIVEQRGGEGATQCENRTERAEGGYYVCGNCEYCSGSGKSGTIKREMNVGSKEANKYVPYRYKPLYGEE